MLQHSRHAGSFPRSYCHRLAAVLYSDISITMTNATLPTVIDKHRVLTSRSPPFVTSVRRRVIVYGMRQISSLKWISNWQNYIIRLVPIKCILQPFKHFYFGFFREAEGSGGCGKNPEASEQPTPKDTISMKKSVGLCPHMTAWEQQWPDLNFHMVLGAVKMEMQTVWEVETAR